RKVDFSCFGYHPDLESRLTFQEKWVLAAGCPPVMTHGQGGLPPKESNVIASELAAGVEQRPPSRGNWMGELGERVVALWTHWRRERAIKSAVAALAKYDQRTLRDLGIHGRADIERMVRYCRDC
ncbi:DUF1127 domain-containing protein, partial [Bradyrhizobium liaoningense]|uniref:DUF1127 domain-containing protein n=1 Tax=Bradyrhizobium liaoningense TaxID=43992 RepID=UPI001BAD6131